MASLSIIMSEWTTIRSLCEYKNEWLKSGIVIILTILLRYFLNNSITILWFLNILWYLNNYE